MACGSPVRDRADYPRDPSREQLESGMDAHFIRVAKSDLRAGDLVGIDFKGVVRHVGIIGQHPEY